MINQVEFERLINMPESSTLDFKAKMYDFQDDKDLSKTAKFVKDIISFTNTIRNENSYIILGIEESTDFTKILHGLDKFIDDSILQDKIKDKVFPRPQFHFYTIDYDSKKFGLIEFPIVKYPSPIEAKIKMKGIDVGRIYYRQGTTNTEAFGHEIIRINDWLRNLPDNNSEISLNDEVSELLKKLTSKDTKLSIILAEILMFSKKYNKSELTELCVSEIKGIGSEESSDKYNYRVQKVIISPIDIEINQRPYVKVTPDMIKHEMENSDDFHDYSFAFSYPIQQIEDTLERFKNIPDTFAKFKISSKTLFSNNKSKDYPVTVYIFEDTFVNLYRSIRQKLIDKLIEL